MIYTYVNKRIDTSTHLQIYYMLERKVLTDVRKYLGKTVSVHEYIYINRHISRVHTRNKFNDGNYAFT